MWMMTKRPRWCLSSLAISRSGLTRALLPREVTHQEWCYPQVRSGLRIGLSYTQRELESTRLLLVSFVVQLCL